MDYGDNGTHLPNIPYFDDDIFLFQFNLHHVCDTSSRLLWIN